MLALSKAFTAGVVLLALVMPASAQVLHCFDSANGPEVPCTAAGGGSGAGGGGYAAPAPSGPSPAEIARRQRIAAGNAANDRGAAALRRGDLPAAVRYFEEAMRLWPEDRNVQENYLFAKAELAASNGSDREAADYYRKVLRYSPNNKNIIFKLKQAEERAAADRRDWADAAGKAGGYAKHYYEGRLAIQDQDWNKAIAELREFQSVLPSMLANGRKAVGSFHQAERAFLDAHALADAGRVHNLLVGAEKKLADNEKLSVETDKYLKVALAGKARQEEAQRLSVQDGGALGQAKAAKYYGNAGASQSGNESLTVPGGPDEKASDQAAKPFDQGVPVPASSGPVFARSSGSSGQTAQSEFSEAIAAKLRATPEGRELIAKEARLRGDLEQVQTTIAKLRTEPNAASNPDYAKALIAQDQIYGKLNELPKQAAKITQVVLDPNGAKGASNEPPSPATLVVPAGSQ